MKNSLLCVLALLFTVCVSNSALFAQAPDSRIWKKNWRQVQMLNSDVWLEVPRSVEQSGNFLLWPATQGFRPNINALFEPGNLAIRNYRSASLPIFQQSGFRILQDRIIYNSIWEVESVSRNTGLRFYQRVFKAQNGFIVVTATGKSNSWKHSSVTQMLESMETIMAKGL